QRLRQVDGVLRVEDDPMMSSRLVGVEDRLAQREARPTWAARRRARIRLVAGGGHRQHLGRATRAATRAASGAASGAACPTAAPACAAATGAARVRTARAA